MKERREELRMKESKSTLAIIQYCRRICDELMKSFRDQSGDLYQPGPSGINPFAAKGAFNSSTLSSSGRNLSLGCEFNENDLRLFAHRANICGTNRR